MANLAEIPQNTEAFQGKRRNYGSLYSGDARGYLHGISGYHTKFH